VGGKSCAAEPAQAEPGAADLIRPANQYKLFIFNVLRRLPGGWGPEPSAARAGLARRLNSGADPRAELPGRGLRTGLASAEDTRARR